MSNPGSITTFAIPNQQTKTNAYEKVPFICNSIDH